MYCYYTASLAEQPRPDGLTLIHLAFGPEPAGNDRIVPAAIAALEALRLPGGPGILFNGPASVPTAMALAHAVAHRYGFVACFDPKLQRYVVVISHTPDRRPGQLIE